MPEKPLILTPGTIAAPVGNIQEQLNTVAYYGLAVDNIYGPLTEAAVRNFQTGARLPVTGIVDPATWRRLFAGNPLPAEVVADGQVQGQGAALAQAGGTRIEVNLGERLLRLLRDGNVAATYPVAIGKSATPTPTGEFSILNKAFEPGGVFGTRWLGVTPEGIGIHGTSVPSSIGLAVSNGCMRMFNQDVEELYGQVEVGTPVIIVGGAAAPGAGVFHTVQPGDTIFTLALRFGTTVAAIMSANNLTSDVLQVGQVLFIPGPTAGGPSSTYTVLPGDTLFGIAQRFGTTVSALRITNSLTSDVVFPGQVLQIPTVPYAPPAPGPGPGPAPGPGTTTYVVQPGDTLYLIAQLFNTPLARLRALNNLPGDVIIPGRVLIVPGPAEAAPPSGEAAPPAGEAPAVTQQAVPSGTTYVVQPGDTLIGVAERFGTTVTELARLNALTTTEVFPGQILRVA